MKRFVPYLACVVGLILTAILLPLFNAAQPKGIRLTRGDAIPVADRAAREVGIPVDRSWRTLSWSDSPILNKELETNADLRRRANDDLVLGPRLGGYRRMYYRRGLEKNPPYGYVVVDPRSGDVLTARRRLRPEEADKKLTEAQLRPRAEAFVHSRNFPGAPSPRFESARPTEYRARTDWAF
ncbi:MAG: hypothetical protein DMF58_10110, partial [Acidobacteria bacterium]